MNRELINDATRFGLLCALVALVILLSSIFFAPALRKMEITRLESEVAYYTGEKQEPVVVVQEVTAVKIPDKKDLVLLYAQDFASQKEYVEDVYDCTEFSRDIKELLDSKFGDSIKVERIEQVVNCSYTDIWVADNCKKYNGLHEFLYIILDDGTNPFYLESIRGIEITKDMYKYYNLVE